MASVSWRLALVGVALLARGAVALGGSYADPSGFSFTYPDGWVPVSRVVMAEANQALPHRVKAWVAENNVNLDEVAVVLLWDGRDDFSENLNVVVEDQQITVDERTAREFTAKLAPRYTAMGVTVDDMQGRVEKVGSRDAVVVEYQARMPGVIHPLRQRQVMVAGGGKTFIVTGTAKADSFDAHRPTFERILASFQVPAPVAQGFGWGRIASGAVRGAVVGGLVGGLLGGLAWVVKRLSSKTKPPRGDDGSPGAGGGQE